jgi:anaerobic selenocysteine-containing dehydrogenase
MGGGIKLDEKAYEKLAGVDKYPVLEWWQYWADAASVYTQISTGDPYPIVGGICQSGDFMNMGNSLFNWDQFNDLEFFATMDLWHTPLSGKSDLLLPAAHWLEANATRPSQGASGALGLTVQCVERPGEVEYDPVFNIKLFEAMGVPFSLDPTNPWPNEEQYCDFYVRGSGKSWKENVAEFQANGWWDCKAMSPVWKSTWGIYRRYEMGMLRPDRLPGMMTPTGKLELWSTVMETFYSEESDILPDYREVPLSRTNAPDQAEEYPLMCNTGRRIPVYFHNEHRQLPWCRELWPVPRIEINPEDADKYGIKQGDWVWIRNKNGKIRQAADIYAGIEPGVVNCEHQWWFPELNQSGRGFELSGVNCLVTHGLGDRHSGSTYLRDYPVKIYKATASNSPFGNPVPCGVDGTEIIHDSSDPRLKEWANLNYEGKE